MRKCLKVEYLGRIEYDFQNSRVTGHWDHKNSVSAKKVLEKGLCTYNNYNLISAVHSVLLKLKNILEKTDFSFKNI
jgi:hypothetical protein